MIQNDTKIICFYIATCGDNLDVIEDNIRFFKGKKPENKPYPSFIFDYRNKRWIDISKEVTIPSIEANICFSACRSNGYGLDAIDFFMNCNFKYTFTCVWIKLSLLRKKLNVGFTKKMAPDWGKVANELKELIDNKFARRIIK